jgi:methylenetetrahydrofolate dehydrogenase (NADP+)/methenyltetrahydrofolate cyclohydrolase
MRLLDGRAAAGYIKERHVGQALGLDVPPRLVIVREGEDESVDSYIRAKRSYGADIGVAVEVFSETADTLVERVKALGSYMSVTGVIVQLPLAHPELTDAALAAVPVAKDVDGLAPGSTFEPATPKAIAWLLAAFNVDLAGKTVAVVGQGRLVGAPLSDRLESSGIRVLRLDKSTPDLAAALLTADVIITATGRPGLITSAMIAPNAVVVDAGAPASDLAPDVADRTDLTITPNPGGVGPMTVAALFDNLLIAAQT